MVRPARVVGSAVLVAEYAVLSVRHEPLFLFLKPALEVVGSEHIVSFLLEDDVEILSLGIVYALIIYLWQSVKFLSKGFKLSPFLSIFDGRKLAKVSILRMQGEDTDRGIRVRVGPSVSDGGVIDRQHLQNALTCERHPIYHLLQIAEVSHSETALRAEREYRNSGACEAVSRDREVCILQIDRLLDVISRHRNLESAVHSCFPDYRYVRVFIIYEELHLYGEACYHSDIEESCPLIITSVI